MGLAISNSYVQNTVNSLTSVISTSIDNATNNIQINCQSQNIIQGFFGSYPTEIDANGNTKFANCVPPAEISSVNVNQTAQNICNIQGGLSNQNIQNITNNLQTNIDQWLSANAKANNGFLGFGVSIANSEGINQVNLSTQIAQAMTTNISQVCSASLSTANAGKFYFCGRYPNGIAISQNAVNSNLTSCLLNNLVTQIGNNTVLNGIVQKAAASADAANSGLNLAGLLKWLIIGAVIIAVLILIGVILYFAFGGNKSTPDQNKTEERQAMERRLLLMTAERRREREIQLHDRER